MKKSWILFVGCLLAAAPASAQQPFDAAQLLTDVAVLSADSLEGRAAGSVGGAKARAYLLAAFAQRQVAPYGESYEQPFFFRGRGDDTLRGVNVVGYVPGTAHPETFVVVTAHYDHLGLRRGQVFNGADDNASGVAGLLALAAYFTRHPPQHSILFAALDAEEMGLQGARAFVREGPVDVGRIALNVNLDMISRNAQGVLYASGTYPYPWLKPSLKRVAGRSKITLRFGHDQPSGAAGEDWTRSSDHGPFHQSGIPFVYFGVEDHPDYHQPTDDFANIDPAFFICAVETILDAVVELDANLEAIRAPAGH